MLRRSVCTRISIAFALLVGVGLCVGRITASHAQSATTPIVDVALSKNLTGPAIVHGGSSYKCQILDKTVQMANLPISLYFTVSSNTHCDELYHYFNGTLNTQWNLTLRTDQNGFGTHQGSFRWQDAQGNVIEGTMQGTIGCGTHRLPGVHDGDSSTENCEECRAAYHVEGLLVGQVVSGPMKQGYGSVAVNASYAGMLEGGGLTAIKSAVLSLDGVTIIPTHPIK